MSRLKNLFYLFIIIFSVLFAAGCSAAIPAPIVGLVRSPIGTPTTSKTYTPTITLTETSTLTITPTQTRTYTETSTPDISQDLAHPENLPKITLEELTSPKFAQDFLDAAKSGKVPRAPLTAKPAAIKIEYIYDPDLIAKYGSAPLFSFDGKKAAAAGDNLADLSQRSSYVAAGYQVVTETGEIVYAVIIGYVNPNGAPDGYWGYILPNSTILAEYFPEKDPTVITAAEYVPNQKGLDKYLGEVNSAIDTWYIAASGKNSELVIPIQTVTAWQNTGILKNTFNGNPFIPFTFPSHASLPPV